MVFMSWKVSEKSREKMPASCFMKPGECKYPYKKKINGKWQATPQGLRAVISRANSNGDTAIAKRASAMLARLQGKGK